MQILQHNYLMSNTLCKPEESIPYFEFFLALLLSVAEIMLYFCVADRYIPLSSVLEGFVILKLNPDYQQDHLSS
jgi:hypothetical protein